MALDRRISHPRQVVAVGDEVEVTVHLDRARAAPHRLSMVEGARASATRRSNGQRDEQTLVGQVNEQRSLGTFADLLAQRGDKDR